MLHAVIMAGGSGTRFWPQSRKRTPKQLLPLAGTETLIQQAVARCSPCVPAERVHVVTNALQVEQSRSQLPQVPAGNFIAEPCGRNTAPCIGLAALELVRRDPDAVMLVMPADHVIRPIESFCDAVERAVGLVDQDPRRLVLFGVVPNYPATGFGYIRRGESLTGTSRHISRNALASGSDEDKPDASAFRLIDRGAYRVDSFREKPNLETAREYLRTGDFFWNCGIFVWRASRILDAIQEFEPQLHDGLMTLGESLGTDRWPTALAEQFPQLKSISIDYAVLERASDVCVVEAPFDWDDVGSWQALPRLIGSDAQGNSINGLHVGVSTSNCIIKTTEDHLVATAGLSDCIIVHTPDVTLVARRDDEDAIRQLVAMVERQGLGRFL